MAATFFSHCCAALGQLDENEPQPIGIRSHTPPRLRLLMTSQPSHDSAYALPLHPDDVAANEAAAAHARRMELILQAPVLSTCFRELKQRIDQRRQQRQRSAAIAALMPHPAGGAAALPYSSQDSSNSGRSSSMGSAQQAAIAAASYGHGLEASFDLLSRSLAVSLHQLNERMQSLTSALSAQTEKARAAYAKGEQRAAELEARQRSLQSQLLDERREAERREEASRQTQYALEQQLGQLKQLWQQQHQPHQQGGHDSGASASASSLQQPPLSPIAEQPERQIISPRQQQLDDSLSIAIGAKLPSFAFANAEATSNDPASSKRVEMKIQSAWQTEGAAGPPSFDSPSADSSDNEGGEAWMDYQQAGYGSDEDESGLAGDQEEPVGLMDGAPTGSALDRTSPFPTALHAQPPAPSPPPPPPKPKAKAKAKPKTNRRGKAPVKKRRICFSQRRDGRSDESEDEEDDCSNYSSDSNADVVESDREEEQPAPPSSAAPRRARPQPSKAAPKGPAAVAAGLGAGPGADAGASSQAAAAVANPNKRSQARAPSGSRPSRTLSARPFESLTQPVESMEDSYTCVPVMETEFGLRALRPRKRANSMRGGFVYSQG